MTQGTEEGTFSFINPQVSTIPAGAYLDFILNFSPTTVGQKSATFIIPSNDLTNPQFSFAIQGNGISTAKDIISFSIPVFETTFTITGTDIVVSVPFGKATGEHVAKFTTTGISVTVNGINQTSEISIVDFSAPVEYIVTAADGSTKFFTVTLIARPPIPVLGITTVTDITITSAIIGGNITSDEGSPITERGICWSTSQDPDISDNRVVFTGTGLGLFTGLVTGFNPGQFYYVRAFATNALGTGYGSQSSFATLPEAPLAPVASTVRYPAGSGQLAVSWTAVNGSSIYYDVYCSTSNTKPDTAYDSYFNLTTTSCTLTGLENYYNYYVWIVAKNATGSSAPSASSTPAMVGVPVTSITLSKASVKVWPGYSETVTVTYTPIDATKPNVNWGTSNASYVTVSNGTATGVGGETVNPSGVFGTAIITASAVDGQGATAKSFTATNTLFATNTAGPAGGVLFYDSGSYGTKGWRYMETASANVGAGHTWNNLTGAVIPGATQSSFGTGKTNTTAIIAAIGVGAYFASDCKNCIQGGYTDWFMPSQEEANQLLNIVTNSTFEIYTFFSSTQNPGVSNVQGYSNSLATVAFRWTAVFANYTGGGSWFITRPVRQF